MLQIQHIKKEYRTGTLVQKALDDVSLNLRDNEFVAILGPSGSGKTTLLNIIGGLDRYDSGDLIINGISTKKYKDRDWDSYRNHTIGFVFQSYNLVRELTGYENMVLPLMLDKRKPEEAYLNRLIDILGIRERLDHLPGAMSGGQQQRFAIARALANKPEILFADEPTGNLDGQAGRLVMDLLRELNRELGVTLVLVTHDLGVAEQAERILHLTDGKIVRDSGEAAI